MAIRDIVLQELTIENLTDQQIAVRNGLNEPSVRRARRELVVRGAVEEKDSYYSGFGQFQTVWGLAPTPSSSAPV